MIARHTRKAVKKRKIRLLGYLPVDIGRPPAVFGWHPVKIDNLQHEVDVTHAWGAITNWGKRAHTALRLDDVNPQFKPDMELWLEENDHYFVELDRGTVSHSRQQKRWEPYRVLSPETNELLIVTTSKKRMMELIRHAEAIAHIALFCVLEDLVQTPNAKIWLDCNGGQHNV